MKGDEEKARAFGCDHYVTKPYSPLQLMRTIGASSATKDRDLPVPVSSPLLPFPIAKLASELGRSFHILSCAGAEVPPAPDRIAAVATRSAWCQHEKFRPAIGRDQRLDQITNIAQAVAKACVVAHTAGKVWGHTLYWARWHNASAWE